MSDLNTLLNSLGLEYQESKVYLASLSLGTSPASIIGKKCEIPRSTARYTCEQLVKKQLMAVTQKGNTMLFTASPPEALHYLIEKQKEELDKKEDSLNASMQELKKIHNPYTVLPKVTYYEGIDSVIGMLLNNHAKVEDDTYEFSAHIPMLKKYPKEIEEYSVQHMEYRKNHTNYVIDCLKNQQENEKEGASYPNLLFKYYKDKELDLKTHIQVDGEKIALVSAHSDTVVGIDIHHAGIAKDLKQIFKQLWQTLG